MLLVEKGMFQHRSDNALYIDPVLYLDNCILVFFVGIVSLLNCYTNHRVLHITNVSVTSGLFSRK